MLAVQGQVRLTQPLLTGRPLQGSKQKLVLPVTEQHKTYSPVAEIAYAVKKQDFLVR